MLVFCVEFTTMAGRRLRDAVKMVLTSEGNGEFDSNTRIVIAGLTNAYSQYVTTFEEYQVQRYEVHSHIPCHSIKFCIPPCSLHRKLKSPTFTFLLLKNTVLPS